MYIRLSQQIADLVEPRKLLPVMVFIHGGSFVFGSGNGETDLYGPNYLLDRDVVLVTLNYRLAALGVYHFAL